MRPRNSIRSFVRRPVGRSICLSVNWSINNHFFKPQIWLKVAWWSSLIFSHPLLFLLHLLLFHLFLVLFHPGRIVVRLEPVLHTFSQSKRSKESDGGPSDNPFIRLNINCVERYHHWLLIAEVNSVWQRSISYLTSRYHIEVFHFALIF